MRYHHIVRLIDARLEPLQKARQILSSSHLVPLAAPEAISIFSAPFQSQRRSNASASRFAETLPLPVEAGPGAAPMISTPDEAAPPAPMIVSAAEPFEKAPEAAPPSPAKIRSRRERTPSAQRLVPALQRALGGAIPDAPVFVSSKMIETERFGRDVDVPPELTAELLSQRWLGSGAS